jgi:hypothetical protein
MKTPYWVSFVIVKAMKKTQLIIGSLILLNLASLLLFQSTPIHEYDYSNCPPDANCIGELTKTNWTGYLPLINKLSIYMLGITFLVVGFVWVVRKLKMRH